MTDAPSDEGDEEANAATSCDAVPDEELQVQTQFKDVGQR